MVTPQLRFAQPGSRRPSRYAFPDPFTADGLAAESVTDCLHNSLNPQLPQV